MLFSNKFFNMTQKLLCTQALPPFSMEVELTPLKMEGVKQRLVGFSNLKKSKKKSRLGFEETRKFSNYSIFNGVISSIENGVISSIENGVLIEGERIFSIRCSCSKISLTFWTARRQNLAVFLRELFEKEFSCFLEKANQYH